MFTLIPSPTCPRCQRPVLEDAALVVCEACLATHHEKCWHQGQGCSALRPQAPQAPPPVERPVQVRVARSRGVVPAARRRDLVQSLALREGEGESAEAEEDRGEHEASFRPHGLRPEVGTEQTCRKCQKGFVISDPLETRCSRCTQATYWKIGIAFVVIVIWKLIF